MGCGSATPSHPQNNTTIGDSKGPQAIPVNSKSLPLTFGAWVGPPPHPDGAPWSSHPPLTPIDPSPTLRPCNSHPPPRLHPPPSRLCHLPGPLFTAFGSRTPFDKWSRCCRFVPRSDSSLFIFLLVLVLAQASPCSICIFDRFLFCPLINFDRPESLGHTPRAICGAVRWSSRRSPHPAGKGAEGGGGGVLCFCGDIGPRPSIPNDCLCRGKLWGGGGGGYFMQGN